MVFYSAPRLQKFSMYLPCHSFRKILILIGSVNSTRKQPIVWRKSAHLKR